MNSERKEVKQMKEKLLGFLRDEEGATAVEYGIMVALIAVAIIGAVTALSGAIQDTFNTAAEQMPGTTPPAN
jgi:pilus assembly protein Flp/PilA